MKKKKFIFIVAMATLVCCAFIFSSYTKNEETYFDVGQFFIPSGHMGCAESVPIIAINTADFTQPHSGQTCIRVEINSWANCGRTLWAGVYWQNKENNWGNESGENFSGKGFTKVTFWAKGHKGKEVVIFGSGGINKLQYKDSYNTRYTTEGKNVILSNQWKQYVINLTEADLSSVIGGFFFSVEERANQDGLTFYLDDIYFE